MSNFIFLKLIKSFIGIKKKNKSILKSLGLFKINFIKKIINNSINRGKIKKVFNFIKILFIC